MNWPLSIDYTNNNGHCYDESDIYGKLPQSSISWRVPQPENTYECQVDYNQSLRKYLSRKNLRCHMMKMCNDKKACTVSQPENSFYYWYVGVLNLLRICHPLRIVVSSQMSAKVLNVDWQRPCKTVKTFCILTKASRLLLKLTRMSICCFQIKEGTGEGARFQQVGSF